MSQVETTQQPENPATTEQPVSKKTPKKPGVVQFIIDTHIAAYPDGLENAVAEQMLAQQFPDRDAKSMANTLKLQPHYLCKNKGLNVVSGTKAGWCIAPAGVPAPTPAPVDDTVILTTATPAEPVAPNDDPATSADGAAEPLAPELQDSEVGPTPSLPDAVEPNLQ